MKTLEKIMGPGLAAPETPRMRVLRWAVIALTSLVCGGVLLIDVISTMIGAVVTGGVFATLLAATMGVGVVYFVLKSRRDDAWLDERCRPLDGD